MNETWTLLQVYLQTMKKDTLLILTKKIAINGFTLQYTEAVSDGAHWMVTPLDLYIYKRT